MENTYRPRQFELFQICLFAVYTMGTGFECKQMGDWEGGGGVIPGAAPKFIVIG